MIRKLKCVAFFVMFIFFSAGINAHQRSANIEYSDVSTCFTKKGLSLSGFVKTLPNGRSELMVVEETTPGQYKEVCLSKTKPGEAKEYLGIEIVTNQQGVVAITWYEYTKKGQSNIYLAIKKPLAKWEVFEKINSGLHHLVNCSECPTLAINNNQVVIVWVTISECPDLCLYACNFSGKGLGTKIIEEARIKRDFHRVLFPKVAISYQSEVIITWQKGVEWDLSVLRGLFFKGKLKNSNFFTFKQENGIVNQSMYVDDEGQVVIAWNNCLGNIQLFTTWPNHNWSDGNLPEIIDLQKVLGKSFSPGWNPDVCIDGEGQIHVVWESFKPNADMYMASRSASGRWSTEKLSQCILKNKELECLTPNIYLLDQEEVKLVWSERVLGRKLQKIVFSNMNRQKRWSVPKVVGVYPK